MAFGRGNKKDDKKAAKPAKAPKPKKAKKPVDPQLAAKRAGKRIWYTLWLKKYPPVASDPIASAEAETSEEEVGTKTAATSSGAANSLADLNIDDLDGSMFQEDPAPETTKAGAPQGKGAKAGAATKQTKAAQGAPPAQAVGKPVSLVDFLTSLVAGSSESFYAVQEYFDGVDPNDAAAWKAARTKLVSGLGKKLNRSVEQKAVTKAQAEEISRDAMRLANAVRLFRLELSKLGNGAAKPAAPAPTPSAAKPAKPPETPVAAKVTPAPKVPPAPIEAPPPAEAPATSGSAADDSFTIGANAEMDIETLDEGSGDDLLLGSEPLQTPEEGGTVGGDDLLPMPSTASSTGQSGVLGSDSEIEIDFGPSPDEPKKKDDEDLGLADLSDVDVEGKKKKKDDKDKK